VTVAAPAAARVSVRTLLGASDIPAIEWNSLARRGFHLHNWFLSAERCGWSARHVALTRGGVLLGVVPAYLTGRGSLHDLHDRWLGPLRWVSEAGMAIRPVLSVQAPFAIMSQPLGDTEIRSPALLHRVFEALEASAHTAGAKAVAWPAVDHDEAQVIQVALERGYSAVYAGASARINVEWDSFDDYLSSRSKNVRRTIKADLGSIRSAGLHSELVSEFRHAVPAIDTLYREAFRRRNLRDAPVHPNIFGELSQRPSSGIRAQLTWSGSRLVGSSLNLMTSDLLEGTFGAFSAEHRSGPVYYNDLCYEPIRVACRERMAAIDLGATALYPKVLRGAVLRPRLTLIKGATPAGHKALSLLGRLVARRTQWKERRALGPLWGKISGGQREAMWLDSV
jgi:predicted N-acyltransferase